MKNTTRQSGVCSSEHQSGDRQKATKDGAKERRRIAYHEAGHFIVACHFGLDGYAVVKNDRRGRQRRAGHSKHVLFRFDWHNGLCYFMTPFKNSVISWAGKVGEGFLETSKSKRREFIDALPRKLSTDEFSWSDKFGILMSTDKEEALWHAADILEDHGNQLVEVANLLMTGGKVRRKEHIACAASIGGGLEEGCQCFCQ